MSLFICNSIQSMECCYLHTSVNPSHRCSHRFDSQMTPVVWIEMTPIDSKAWPISRTVTKTVTLDPVKMIILAIIPINSIELFIPSCDVTQTWSIKYHLDTSDSQMLFPVYTSPKNLRTLYLLSFSVCLLSTRGNLCPHRSTVIPQIDLSEKEYGWGFRLL